MKYLVRQEQKAALSRALNKIEKAKPGGIVGLTEREMQAWMDKVPLYESPTDLDVVNPIGESPLASMVTPPQEKKEKPKKRKVIRWMRINKEDNSWTAGVWTLDTTGSRKSLAKRISEWQAEPQLVGSPDYEYSIDEREMQDDESY